MMINALSFDVEDGWSIFSRDRLHKQIKVTDDVVKDTELVLGLLEQQGVTATFFVLGNAKFVYKEAPFSGAQFYHLPNR